MSNERERLLEMVVSLAPFGHVERRRAEASALLDKLIQDARVEQARMDAELMQIQAQRSPNTTPPKGGTNSRAVFESAAKMLHPDELGWGLELPDHLKPMTEEGQS